METNNLPCALKAVLGVLTNSLNELEMSIRALIFSGMDHLWLPGALILVVPSSSKLRPKVGSYIVPLQGTGRDTDGERILNNREKP